MAFSALTTEETNADSPLDTTLFTKIKDNFDDLDAARVTNGDSHDHVGGDGAQIAAAGLSFTTGSQASTTVGATSVLTVTVNRYYHMDTMGSQRTGGDFHHRLALSVSTGAAGNKIDLMNNFSTTSFSAVSMTWDYHSS